MTCFFDTETSKVVRFRSWAPPPPVVAVKHIEPEDDDRAPTQWESMMRSVRGE